MLAETVGLLVILAAALGFALVLLVLHARIGSRRRSAAQPEATEGDERSLVGRPPRLSVNYYLAAVLFVVFGVQAVIFYPWGATLRETGWPALVGMAVFALPLVIGLLYEWSKGALEW